MDFQTSCKDSITKSDISPRKLNYNTTKSTVENLKKKKLYNKIRSCNFFHQTILYDLL